MKLKLTLIALLVPCLLWAQKHQARFDAIDVQHYIFNLRLNDESDTIDGLAYVKVEFKKAIEFLELDLVNVSEGKGMQVIDAAEADKPLEFKHENDLVRIKVNAKAGETRTIKVMYEGIPKTGLIIAKNKYGDRTFFGDNWPDRGKNWLPIVDHPSDKATVEWKVTAPKHYQVVANGLLENRLELDGDRTLTEWKNEVPLPTKVMVIGVARFAIDKSGEVEGKEISSWVYPQNEKEGFYDYALAPAITQWFTDRIGPYPFAKLANVQSKTQFGGMENAGNIFYFENSVTGQRTIEGLIAHEIAHQWFGNSASEANWHHVWLSEGFATYFTILYMEDKYGVEKAAAELQKDREQIIAFNNRNSVPVVNTAVTNYMRLLNANSYQKGSFVLHMLRNEVGDQVFWEAVRNYYDRYKLSNALTEDLKAIFEEESGNDLDYFFDQWIFQAGHPVLEAHIKADKRGILLKQHQKGKFFFELEVLFEFEDGSQDRVIYGITDREELLEPQTDKPIKSFTLDPDTKLLFEAKVAGN